MAADPTRSVGCEAARAGTAPVSVAERVVCLPCADDHPFHLVEKALDDGVASSSALSDAR